MYMYRAGAVPYNAKPAVLVRYCTMQSLQCWYSTVQCKAYSAGTVPYNAKCAVLVQYCTMQKRTVLVQYHTMYMYWFSAGDWLLDFIKHIARCCQ